MRRAGSFAIWPRSALVLPLLLLPLLLLVLAGCATPPAPPPWRDSPAAVADQHRNGLPHTDRLGQPRRQLDPVRSFFPLILDNAMVDYSRGLRFGFAAAYEAGFNAVSPWSGQPRNAALAAAAGSRLLLALNPEEAAAARAEDGADLQALLDARTVRLVRIMPFSARGPEASSPADIASPADIDSALNALRQAVAQRPNDPAWSVLQAFAAPAIGLRLPSSAEARALAYGALIGGASGLIWLGEDSYVSRSGGALGIGPALPLDYGVQLPESEQGPPFKPEPAQVGQARALWQTVARLNREIERLSPALLSPTAQTPPRAELLPLDDGPPLAEGETPIRLLLKQQDGVQPGGQIGGQIGGHLTLLAANLSHRPWRLRISLPGGIKRLERWFDTDPAPALNAGNRQFEEDFPPLGVRVYRLTP